MDKSKEVTQMAETNVLLGIINGILDFSKIEAGKLEIESAPFALVDLIENLAAVIGSKASEKGIEMVFDFKGVDSPTLLGDSLRLGQVLLNLVSNAVKFTDEGEILVSVEVINVEERAAWLRFSVADTGIGMSPDQIPHLFKEFSQAEAHITRKYGGTGLGLAISKRLVELMGGTLSVESTLGKGTRFEFSLKFLIGDGPQARKELPRSIREMNALVVDDVDSSRVVFSSYLEKFGMKSTSVASGEEAIHELRRASVSGAAYDLMIVDWKMPKLDGIETTRAVLSDQILTTKPKIILATAFGSDNLADKLATVEIDGLLIKPTTPSTLYNTLVSIFDKKRVPGFRTRPAEKKSPGVLESIAGARVLLVEDNELNQDVARDVLQGEGLVVTVAADGRSAIATLLSAPADAPFDIVLMDLHMPVMNGYEATAEIRSHERFKKLPIIAMTADTVGDISETVFARGMNDYVSKPISFDDLFESLLNLIPHKSVQLRSKTSSRARKNGPSLPAVIGGINVKVGLLHLGGDTEIYLRLLRGFLHHRAEELSLIKDAVVAENWDRAADLTHTFKGLVGTIGAELLYAATQAVETFVVGHNSEACIEQIAAAEELFGEVLAGIRELDATMPESEPSSAADTGTRHPEATLAQLVDYLKLSDTRAGTILGELQSWFGAADLEPQYSALVDLLRQYKFQEALSLVQSFQKEKSFFKVQA